MAYELKTKKTKRSVAAFLKGIANDQRRDDCAAVVKIMEQITKAKPEMWGDSIIGFGTYSFKYASGHKSDWFVTGLSPRKNDLTLYIMSGLGNHDDLLKTLGKHKATKSCLHITKLEQVNIPVLKNLIRESVKRVKKNSVAD